MGQSLQLLDNVSIQQQVLGNQKVRRWDVELLLTGNIFCLLLDAGFCPFYLRQPEEKLPLAGR